MANIKKCDRCGAHYDNADSEHYINLDCFRSGLIISAQIGSDHILRKYRDLCDDCIEKLVLFMDGEKDDNAS